MATEDLAPTSDTVQDWAGGGTYNYDDVDEAYGSASFTDTLETDYADRTDQYGLSATAVMGSGDITSQIEIMTYVRYTQSGYPGLMECRLYIDSSWETSVEGEVAIPGAVDTPVWMTWTFAGAWTKAQVDACEAEVTDTASGGGSSNDDMGCVVVRVTYAPTGITKAGTDTDGSRSTTSPMTWQHTLVAGDDRVVVVSFGMENSNDAGTWTITYGGEVVTLEVEAEQEGSFNYSGIAYILEADLPSNGEHDVVVAFDGSASNLYMIGCCAQYDGVSQDAPDFSDASGQTTGNTISNTGFSIVSGDLVVSAMSVNSMGSYVHGQSQNELFDIQFSSQTSAFTDLIATGVLSSLDSTYTGSVSRLVRAAASWSPVSGGETIDFLSTVALVSVLTASDLNISRLLLSTVSPVTVLGTIDLDKTLDLTSTVSNQSVFSSVDLDKTLNLLSTIGNQTVISSADLDKLLNFTSTVSWQSILTGADLPVSRLLNSVVANQSVVSAVDVPVSRLLVTSMNSTTVLSSIDLSNLIAFVSAMNMQSVLSSIDLDRLVSFISTISNTSVISSVDFNVLRSLVSTVDIVSVFSEIILLIAGIIDFQSAINVVSVLVNIDITRILNLSTSANLISSLSAPDIDILVSLQSAVAAQSSLSNIDLGFILNFISSISMQSILSSIDLDSLVAFQSVINSVSVLSSIDLNAIVNLNSTITSETVLSDAQLAILRNLFSTIDVVTLMSAITLLSGTIDEILSSIVKDKSIIYSTKDLTKSITRAKEVSTYRMSNKSDILTGRNKTF